MSEDEGTGEFDHLTRDELIEMIVDLRSQIVEDTISNAEYRLLLSQKLSAQEDIIHSLQEYHSARVNPEPKLDQAEKQEPQPVDYMSFINGC